MAANSSVRSQLAGRPTVLTPPTGFSRCSRGSLRLPLTIVTNANPGTRAAVQRSVEAGSRDIREEPIGLEYPPGVFSLSHIAVPFPTSDPLYGLNPDEAEFYGIRLGTLALHGERNALRVSLEQLARIGSNPFYPYLEQRALAWLESGRAACTIDQPAVGPTAVRC
jgi:hypothetical protein